MAKPDLAEVALTIRAKHFVSMLLVIVGGAASITATVVVTTSTISAKADAAYAGLLDTRGELRAIRCYMQKQYEYDTRKIISNERCEEYARPKQG